ncbi:MAG: CocE/NonD family hydrolase [Candidatus Latescibacterota bacterium]
MPSNYGVEMRLDVRVPARDGVALSSDIYLPRVEGKVPTVLIRTPYSNNADPMVEKGRRLASQGYACLIQDCRGRWDSEGVYYPFREGPDGFDTQEWIGRQEWSDGRVGMVGGSYVGTVQWQSAPLQSAHLRCITPRVICTDYYSGLVWPGGAFQLNVMATWGMRTNAHTGQTIDFHHWAEAFRALPLLSLAEQAGRDLPFWKDWVGHPSYDAYWEGLNGEKLFGEIAVPALNMGGWYDLYAPQAFTNYNGLRQHGRTPEARQSRLIVGPWPHALSTSPRTGDVDFGAGSVVDLEALELRWLDHWLKGVDTGLTREPPIRLFIMGINRWRDEAEWPLARTRWQPWYLHSGGRANTVIGDGVLAAGPPGQEAPDHYVYDPLYPVPTRGGNNCCSPHIVPWGPQDQRCLEMRTDVLCYTSAPLAADLEVTGPIRVVLFAATDGPDTDWTAKLVDVWPSGYAMNLCDGILRARYREGFTAPRMVEPGAVYRYELEVGVTGNVFRQGHQIRLEVSSSNFPRFDRNLNTGGDLGTQTRMRQAHQTVHHSRDYPSHVVLPVIPR